MKKNEIGLFLSILASQLIADNVVVLDSVSVTALREEERVVDQPLSISQKSEKEIALDQVIFQKDLLNSMAGVRVEQTTSIIGHKTSIRMPSTTGPYYLFLQDGIPVQSSGFFNHNGLAYTTFETATSTEVLKGAGTALYGSDAVAAVVNVQSAKAPSKEYMGRANVKGGSDGYVSGLIESSDTIDEDSSYRANINYSQSDGWRDHTSYDRFEGNLRYDYLLNDDNSIKVLMSGSRTDAEQADSFENYEMIEDGSTDASDDPNYDIALEKTDVRRKFDYARLSVEWTNYAINDLEIMTTPYIRYNRNQYVATWEKNLPSNDSQQLSLGLQQKNSYEKAWGRIVFGFDTEYTQAAQQYDQDFDLDIPGSWGKPDINYTAGSLYDYNVNYLAIAPYLHTDVALLKELILSAGLRFDYNRFDYTNNLSVGSDASGVYYRPEDRTDDFNHLSPKLSLSYHPLEDFTLYARYANGFRIPQATRLYSQKSNTKDVILDPETSNTFEVGVKKEFAKSYVELATYYMLINDTITRYTDDTTDLNYYENGESSVHKGVELTAYAQLSEEWSAKLAYSYSKHNYQDDKKYGDNEMAEAPNHTGNARLIYRPSYLHGFTTMLEWIYVGSYWMDNENTKEYEGYNLGNLKADYRINDMFSVFGKVSNLTDKRYATSASLSWGNSYTPGDPRQYYGGLEVRW